LPTPEVIGEQLQNLVRATSVEAIKLPGCQIEVDELLISHSIRLVGCPGTELILVKNSVTIHSENSPIQVYFKECSITMRIPYDRTPDPRILFDVYEKASLHLLDCQLKTEYIQAPDSYIISKTSPRIAFEFGKDICVNIRGVEQNPPLPGDINNKICYPVSPSNQNIGPSATIMSCAFLTFYNAVHVGNNGTLRLEKSGFFRAKGYAIYAINPYKMHVEGSKFENCLEGAIEVKWENTENSGPERIVKLENNDISNMKGHVILSSGNSNNTVNSTLEIIGNKIHLCKQDGIHLRKLAISSIEISQNTIQAVNGSGLNLYEVKCPNFDIKHCGIRENGGCGIYITESSCKIQNSDISLNGQSGISVTSHNSSKNEDPVEISISECRANENAQHGITVVDIVNSTVMVSKSKIIGNKEYGLFLFHTDNMSTAISQSLSSSVAIPISLKPIGRVVLSGGEISINKRGGVHISQLFTHIDGTNILDNGEYAIYLPMKRSEKYVAFAGSTIGNKCIQGIVGGKWGRINIYPSAVFHIFEIYIKN